jgi:hypothetical protein
MLVRPPVARPPAAYPGDDMQSLIPIRLVRGFCAPTARGCGPRTFGFDGEARLKCTQVPMKRLSHVSAARQLLEMKTALETEIASHVRVARQLDARIKALIDPSGKLDTIAHHIVRLMEERDALKEDISDIYAEAKGNGYDVAVQKRGERALQLLTDRRLPGGSAQGTPAPGLKPDVHECCAAIGRPQPW